MRIPLILAAMVLAAMPASAQDCEPTTSEPAVAVLGFGYLEIERDCLESCVVVAFWLYEESNGIAGLQRGDDFRDDTCGGKIPSDTIVF